MGEEPTLPLSRHPRLSPIRVHPRYEPAATEEDSQMIPQSRCKSL
jgi:hypothetical protein